MRGYEPELNHAQETTKNESFYYLCSVEWDRQTMPAQGTLFALLLTIGYLFLKLLLLLLRLIARIASIVFSTIAHNLSKKAVYDLVDRF